MNVYIPILVLGAIAAAFAVGSVGIALVIGPRRYNRAKLEAYECGIEPMAPGSAGHETTGQRFPVKYYLTAMLFIVFDVESIFLFPFAVAFDQLGLFALIEMVLFVIAVFIAGAIEKAQDLPGVAPLLQRHRLLLEITIDDQDHTHDALKSGDVIGCVYIYPTRQPGHDVEVQSWVHVDHAAHDDELAQAVADWLAAEWPWRSHYRYGR